MKLQAIKELRNPKKFEKDLENEKDLLITRNGKPYMLVSLVADRDIEDILASVRKYRAFEAIESLQRQSMASGKDKMTMEEVNEIIADVRKDYK